MPWSSVELAEARELIRGLLEALELDAYLFEVEPRNDGWELRLECAADEGWQSFRLPLESSRIIDARENEAARERLLRVVGATLGDCKRRRSRG
ncbi:MAG: hypothetical protein GWN84_14500 [Gammaproteobacteria bacterium]|nr:hypothetical protein [Gammaproteobacteria bacterium]NIR84010.1 hypothetical protein [Gammaproteobacteria bacterium]NIR89154.1 hypothetical protein [Gammaproteobacteria bacterium]NIU04956.1 hypothetical protein [Gammaproteobacteria bacterium]NIV52122.1 hypothetical protein [Gammaproteobacteria bacterium]